jgi:hypothetical protein
MKWKYSSTILTSALDEVEVELNYTDPLLDEMEV